MKHYTKIFMVLVVLLLLNVESYAKPYEKNVVYNNIGGVRTGNDGSLCFVKADRTYCEDGSLGITRGNTMYVTGGGIYQRQGDIITGSDGITCLVYNQGRVTTCF